MKIVEVGKKMREVPLSSLKFGDTFIFDSRIGMVASRYGHDFPLDLVFGREFCLPFEGREWIPHNTPAMLSPSTMVIPVECELQYRLKY